MCLRKEKKKILHKLKKGTWYKRKELGKKKGTLYNAVT